MDFWRGANWLLGGQDLAKDKAVCRGELKSGLNSTDETGLSVDEEGVLQSVKESGESSTSYHEGEDRFGVDDESDNPKSKVDSACPSSG